MLFRNREGAARGELEEDFKETFGGDPQTLVHQGLAKLLEDRCRVRDGIGASAGGAAGAGVRNGRRLPRLGATRIRNRFKRRGDSPQNRRAARDDGRTSGSWPYFADLKSEQQLIKFNDPSSAERAAPAIQRRGAAQSVLLQLSSA